MGGERHGWEDQKQKVWVGGGGGGGGIPRYDKERWDVLNENSFV